MDGPVGVSALPAFSLLIVVIGLIAIHCQRDIRQLVTARNVFLLTIMAWYMLEACLLPNEVLKYTQSAHLMGLAMVALTMIGFLLGYASSPGRTFDSLFRRLVGIERPGVIWAVFVIAVIIGFLPLFVVTQGNPIPILEDAFVPKNRWSSIFQRGRFGGVREAFFELQLFLRAALPLGAAVLVQKRHGRFRKLLVTFFFIFMGARAFNDGTRSKLVEILMPVAAAIYWRLSPSWKRLALSLGLPVIVAVGFLWSAASVLGRNEGRLDWEGAMEADYVGFEMFRELLFLQKHVPEYGPYQWGYTYYVQLVNPIPRFMWPNKPIGDAGLQLAELQGAMKDGQAYLTVSPGLIGEMYWNCGWPGILMISAFFGHLAKSWDRARVFATQSILAFTVFAAGLAIIFVSGRSINMPTIYGMLGLFVLLVFFSKRADRREMLAARTVTGTPRFPDSVRPPMR